MIEDSVILHNSAAGRWLRFDSARQIITAGKLDEVLPALKQIESLVHDRGWFAAGFISYEAAAAFDSALCTHPAGDFPLLWFGLYPAPEEFDLPVPETLSWPTFGSLPRTPEWPKQSPGTAPGSG